MSEVDLEGLGVAGLAEALGERLRTGDQAWLPTFAQDPEDRLSLEPLKVLQGNLQRFRDP